MKGKSPKSSTRYKEPNFYRPQRRNIQIKNIQLKKYPQTVYDSKSKKQKFDQSEFLDTEYMKFSRKDNWQTLTASVFYITSEEYVNFWKTVKMDRTQELPKDN